MAKVVASGEKTAPKTETKKAPVKGIMTHAKDTKRFHAIGITVPGTQINGTVYVPKDIEFPSELHLTFKS